MSALDADRIHLAAGCAELHVHAVEAIASTNAALVDRDFGRVPAAPQLLVTTNQSGGRGRRGRRWICEPGRSLAFSLAFERLVDAEPPPAALTVALGVVTAAALAPWAPDVRLKWPNDLQRGGRKLGGMLVETRRSLPPDSRTTASIERIVVGIGLNLAAPRDAAALAQPACGLFDGAHALDAAETVVGCVAGAVVRGARRFFDEGIAAFLPAWQRFDALRDESIVAFEGERRVAAGRALGIDDSGGLRVLTERGMVVLHGGEISVRRSDALVAPESAR